MPVMEKSYYYMTFTLTSVDGFIKALPKLRKKGYELVTVSELYAIKGKTLKKGVMYFGPNRDK